MSKATVIEIKVPEVFRPFKLEIIVETQEELNCLYVLGNHNRWYDEIAKDHNTICVPSMEVTGEELKDLTSRLFYDTLRPRVPI